MYVYFIPDLHKAGYVLMVSATFDPICDLIIAPVHNQKMIPRCS